MPGPITTTTIHKIEPQVQSTTAIDNLIPGATIPTSRAPNNNNDTHTSNGQSASTSTTTTIPQPSSSPTSFPGPEVNGRPTKVTLYNTKNIRNAAVMTSLVPMVNAAFALSHELSATLPAENLRLAGADQYYMEMGSDPSTFLYTLTWADSSADVETAIGTAAAMRFYGNDSTLVTLPDGTKRHTAFKRLAQPPTDTEVWELRHMAVDVGLQRKGLAGFMMGLVEREVERRFAERRELARSEGGEQEKKVSSSSKLVMFLTTLKETNEFFYLKKGYTTDQEVAVEKGYQGSSNPFSVLHMSKHLNSI